MSTLLSVPDIIDLGDISTSLSLNYQAKGSLFGTRKTFTAGETIALVTDALRWQWDGFPDITEVLASASITINTIGDEGQTITVLINDPNLGIISLGTYTILASDTTTAITATNISAVLQSNTYGYGVSVIGNAITIVAPQGYGSSINGVSPNCVITDIYFISTESNDILTTENNENLIIE